MLAVTVTYCVAVRKSFSLKIDLLDFQSLHQENTFRIFFSGIIINNMFVTLEMLYPV